MERGPAVKGFAAKRGVKWRDEGVQPGQTLDSAPPSTSMILPVTQAEAGVAR